MASVWRLCYMPLLEGQEEETMPKPEEGIIECVGIMADSLEEAMRKLREAYENTHLEWTEEYYEDVGAKSTLCEKCIIIKADHVCTIDLD